MGFKEFKQKFFPDEIDDVDTDYTYSDDEGYVDERASVSPVRQSDSYRSEGTGVAARSAALEMKVVTPTKYEAVTQIADLLLDKKTVLHNLENTNRETARRLIDFLSGVAFSIDGTIKKVANNAYVITPSNVDVGEPQAENNTKRREEPEEPVVDNQGSDFEDFD